MFQILVRSYLSDLQASSAAGGSAPLEPLPDVLLDSDRLPFLDCMPPFAADLGERLASPVKHSPPLTPSPGSDLKRLSLRKLQVSGAGSCWQLRQLAAREGRDSLAADLLLAVVVVLGEDRESISNPVHPKIDYL